MPLPMPNKGEEQPEFMTRCMGHEVMHKEFPEQKQRVAVCMAQWRRAHKMSKPPDKACCLDATIEPVTPQADHPVEDGLHPVKFTANSGGVMEHWFWGRFCLDMAGYEAPTKRIPIMRRHDEEIGFCDDTGTDKGLWAMGYLIKGLPDADKVILGSQKGIPYQSSIYFRPLGSKAIEQLSAEETAIVNGETIKGPASIVRKWTVREVTACLFGVDENTQTQTLAQEEYEMDWKDIDATSLTANRPELVTELKLAAIAEKTQELSDAGATAERNRLKAILETVGPEHLGLGVKCFQDGKTPEQAKCLLADDLLKINAALADENKKLAAAKGLEKAAPVTGGAENEIGKKPVKGKHPFMQLAETIKAEQKLATIEEAMLLARKQDRQLALEYNEWYADQSKNRTSGT